MLIDLGLVALRVVNARQVLGCPKPPSNFLVYAQQLLRFHWKSIFFLKINCFRNLAKQWQMHTVNYPYFLLLRRTDGHKIYVHNGTATIIQSFNDSTLFKNKSFVVTVKRNLQNTANSLSNVWQKCQQIKLPVATRLETFGVLENRMTMGNHFFQHWYQLSTAPNYLLNARDWYDKHWQCLERSPYRTHGKPHAVCTMGDIQILISLILKHSLWSQLHPTPLCTPTTSPRQSDSHCRLSVLKSTRASTGRIARRLVVSRIWSTNSGNWSRMYMSAGCYGDVK